LTVTLIVETGADREACWRPSEKREVVRGGSIKGEERKICAKKEDREGERIALMEKKRAVKMGSQERGVGRTKDRLGRIRTNTGCGGAAHYGVAERASESATYMA